MPPLFQLATPVDESRLKDAAEEVLSLPDNARFAAPGICPLRSARLCGCLARPSTCLWNVPYSRTMQCWKCPGSARHHSFLLLPSALPLNAGKERTTRRLQETNVRLCTVGMAETTQIPPIAGPAFAELLSSNLQSNQEKSLPVACCCRHLHGNKWLPQLGGCAS